MVTFFTTTLAISIVGLISILVFKRFEEATGHTVMSGMRPAIGRFFHRGLVWVEYVIPDTLEYGAKRMSYRAARFVQRLFMSGMHYFEHTLERLLSRVREKTQPTRTDREASSFLREVASYKQSTMRGKESDHQIFEE